MGLPDCAEALAAYDRIAEATRTLAAQAPRSGLLEGGQGFNCESFRLARTLLRAGDERGEQPTNSRRSQPLERIRSSMDATPRRLQSTSDRATTAT